MAAGAHLGPQLAGAQAPGNFVLVKYDIPGDPTWHSRLLLAHVTDGEWIILTPQGDIYAEDLSPDNLDIYGWRAFDPNVGVPYGIDPNHVHDFTHRPGQAAIPNLINEGLVHASHERLRRGIPAPVAPNPAAALAAVGGGAPAGGALVAPLAGGAANPAPAPLGGGGGAAPAAAAPAAPAGAAPQGALQGLNMVPGGGGDAEDARTLSISRDGDGVRFKDYRVAVQESRMVTFADWPINGPRTVKHVITQMVNHGGSPSGHSQAWRVACRMQPTDGPAMEHDSWCRVLEAMIVYDQLDTTNLASAELVVRAIQRLEEKHKHKIASNEDAGEGSLFMGTSGGSRSGLIIDPKLTEWIGSEMQKEALVAKERRKAREERALSRKNEGKAEAQK